MVQAYLHYIEMLEMVYYGFKHRNEYNTMLYHMFTHRCNPKNFERETKEPERAYRSLNIQITDSVREQEIHTSLVNHIANIHLLAESLRDLWAFYIKLKHGFLVLGREWNHRNDCSAIIGHRIIRNSTDHELRHIDLPPESIESIKQNPTVIKDTMQELLAARILELEEKL